jgi:hypothetical protein
VEPVASSESALPGGLRPENNDILCRFRTPRRSVAVLEANLIRIRNDRVTCENDGRYPKGGRNARLCSVLDGCLIDQHDGNVIFHCINPVALVALQALWILAVFQRLLACGANQNFKQVLGKHFEIVRQKGPTQNEQPRIPICDCQFMLRA